MRALFRPFALHAAYTPIETIVFFTIIGTLAYFHVLSAIKHSAFLDPAHTAYAAPALRPSHALYRLGDWVGVREGVWNAAVKAKHDVALEIQQLIFTLEQPKSDHTPLSLASPPLAASAQNLTRHLTTAFPTSSGRYYTSICHRPSNLSEASTIDACFTQQHTGAKTLAQTLSFKPGTRDGWVNALTGNDDDHTVFTDEAGVRFYVDKGRLESVPLNQMRNGKWVAYAARTLLVRFWDLAKKADSLDILLILAGYILMHTTFYLLLTRSRALGSSFFLPLAILSAALLALLISLPIAMALKIHIDPIALTEALPFLVCTVGFDKPLRLARAVFLHPHLSVPPSLVPSTPAPSGYPIVDSSSASSLAPPPTTSNTSLQQLKPAPKIITESLSHVYAPIIRDYVLEIAVLIVGAYSRVGGLKEVCALAALILAVDCLLLCTYLAAILGVMVEVRRIKTIRQMSTRSRSNSISSVGSFASSSTATQPVSALARNPSSSSLARNSSFSSLRDANNAAAGGVAGQKTLRQRVSSALLGGEKGSGLPGYGVYVDGKGRRRVACPTGTSTTRKGKDGKERENPVARLKLLLIASFMTLHILNFITPLTPSKHTYSSAVGHGVNVRKVDITAPGLRTVLNALVDASAPEHDGAPSIEEDGELGVHQVTDIYVKVSPPIYVRVVVPASMLGQSKSSSKQLSTSSLPSAHGTSHAHGITSSRASSSGSSRSPSEFLDSFMSGWTTLVGDPVLSKWIVVLLALSVALNGYLLKGIAAGFVGGDVRVGQALAAAFGGIGEKSNVRFEGVGRKGEESGDEDNEDEVVVQERDGKAVVARSSGRQVQAPPLYSPTGVAVSRPLEIESPASASTSTSVVSPRTLMSPVVPVVQTFTLEDVDRKLKEAAAVEKAQKRLTITPANAHSRPVFSTSTASSSAGPSSIPSSADASSDEADSAVTEPEPEPIRSLEECIDIFDNGPRPLSVSLGLLSDEEVILLAQNGKIAAYALEKVLGMSELERAVRIRRALISRASKTQTLESSDIPISHYDYSRVLGACCENVVGYIPLPLGIAGPLKVDGSLNPIPMATAEGTLVASVSRGCKALNAGGGVTTVLVKDGMTRGPAIDFPSVAMAADAKLWVDSEDGYQTIKAAFESTSRFAKLQSLKTAMAGRTLFVRFATATGDAMGMNMISKGTEKALEVMQIHYPEMVILALSGNYCTDKKPAAINWIEGRGKSVVAEAVVPGKVVKSILKTTVASLVNLNTKKNLVGSAMAGSIGGFNAHAANILTAMFLATGQDPAQNVESSQCMTLMEAVNDGEDLLVTITMPCIEVGTVGGGTVLAPQQAVLDMLGIKGAHPTHPGQNAQALARLIAAAVMAGELSLMAALAAGHLIRAHMAHNRSQTNTPAPSQPATPGLHVVGGMVLGPGGQVASPATVTRAMEKEERTRILPLGPLTPSSSTTSLPPYSR